MRLALTDPWRLPLGGWPTRARPLSLPAFLLELPGVPPAVEHPLAARRDARRACQRATDRFFPGPPRPDPGAPDARGGPA